MATSAQWEFIPNEESDINITDEHYEMTATSTTCRPPERHERIAASLLRKFAVYLKGNPCQVYCGWLGVWFRPEFLHEHVEPEDLAKIQECGCVDAPDLIVDILYPLHRHCLQGPL